MIKRGEIYWVNLDPVVGSEIAKTRPALVVSNDVNNQFAETVTVLPITSNVSKVYPFDVFLPQKISGLKGDTKAKANQIRTVDKRRLGKLVGAVDAAFMDHVGQAVKLHLVLS